ncbi:MAG: hypothetical protein WCK44_04890 [Actinomycetota bacterium]|jgi:hypothetical protein
MKRALIVALCMTTFIPAARAADCLDKACIDVYTQDGKIVIEGRKGSGPVQKKAVAPAPAKKPAPKVRPTPKPLPTGSARPKVTITRKPVIRKVVTPSAKPQSLSDKLIEALPTAGIAYSPSFEPLIKVPVYFWSDIPTFFAKRIEIIGEFVDVKLTPTFFWHYGDGVVYVTDKVGAPYPNGQIRHSYEKPGHYTIELITQWAGDFTVQGVTAHINGDIQTVSVLPITVVAAPTRFTPPITYNR